MIQKTLQKYIFENLSEEGDFVVSDVLVTVPNDSANGDYMTSVALSAAKKLGQNPQDFARELVSKVESKKYSEIEKIEIAGPGFINIILTKEAVRSEIESSEKLQTKYSGKKVLVEHSSPNLFKPFHIGHLMNNIVGESVTRIMKAGGAEVKTMSFPSDVSMGISKALYTIAENEKYKSVKVKIGSITKEDIDILNDIDLEYYVKTIGEAYVDANIYFSLPRDTEIEDVKKIHKEISHLNPQLPHFYEFYEKVKCINIKYFKRILRDILGTNIDTEVYESEVGRIGIEIINNNLEIVFKKSQGAIIYEPSENRKDINTTVFINSEGLPTYAAKDLGLLEYKFQNLMGHFRTEDNYSPNTSIYITDNEQIPHFRTVFAAAEEINETWRDRVSKSLHVPHGRMTFKGQKMSSRLGGVPLAEDTIDAVLQEVRARSGEHIEHLSQEEQEKLWLDISLAALRIAILRAKPGSNINFDPETALQFEGDSGPYLLYTHARCASLLDKAKDQEFVPNKNPEQTISGVERKQMHYKEVLQIVVNEIAPQRLVTYLFELAQEFNSFYNENTIINIADKKTSEHRLYIVSETKKILFEALHTLGINAPDRM